MKKLWMFALTACLFVAILLVLPINAQAAMIIDSGTQYGLTWSLNSEGTLTISGNGAIEYGYAVPWFNHKDKIKSIVIEYGVTRIGNGEFNGTTYLTSVVIPSSVTTIGDDLFGGCTLLTGIYVHKNNRMYSSVDGVLFNKAKTELIMAPYGITEFNNFPSSVTSICDDAFRGCKQLTSITIPDGVTSIGNDAFAYCDRLTSVTIPDGVTSIGSGAFSYCYGLKDITISDSVTSIGRDAFRSCNNLSAITIPKGITSIEDYTFSGCKSLRSISIPDSLTSIGYGAFNGCNNLKYNTYSEAKYLGNADNPYVVLIESTLDSITSCKINAKAKVIAYCAFKDCGELKSITIPKSVTSIGNEAFEACLNLESVTIPDSVTSIGRKAFYNCESLKNISIPDSVTSIGEYAFVGCNNLNFTKYSNAKYLGNTKNPYIFLFESTSDNITSCKIHPKTKFLNDYAFSECEQLETITIPDDVTSIGSDAFEACLNLKSVIIPDSITSIGSDAFSYCSGLRNITIPNSVTSIGSGAFSYCSGLGRITIPDSVTSIGSRVFYCSGLRTIIILDGVTSIGSNAFLGCDELETVYFLGDPPEIAPDAFKDITEAYVYYPDNDETWENLRSGYGGILRWIPYTPFSIITQPSSKVVKTGRTAIFTVSVSGIELDCQWQYRTSSSGSWKNASATGNKTATLSVPASVSRHGYQYRCRVTDIAGNRLYTKTVTLNVLGIKTQPVSKTVVDGKTAKLTVSATGTGLKYQWQYRTPSAGSWKNASATGNKTKTLSVPASVSRHGYQYRCKITDSAGNTVYTKTVSLYVLGIKTQPASKTVKVGATAKFTVAATGTGLKFQWQYRTSSKGSWKNASATGNKTKTLSVPGTVSRNGYQYRCKITDSAGNVIYTNAVKLTVKK